MLFKNNKKEKGKTINKKLKINKSFILIFFIISFFAVPYIVFSATTGSNDFESVKFTPQIKFPGTGISGETDLSQKPGDDGIISSNLLSTYIKAIYDYGLGIAGILAAIMIMAAGIIWLTSGGDSGKIDTAKKFITGSLTGLFLLFGAYIILNTVNPALVEMRPIEVSKIADISRCGEDGYIHDIECLPEDAVVEFLCLREGDTCADTNPPSIQVDYNICQDLDLKKTCDPASPYKRKTCCAKSETINNESDNFCQGKDDYTKCKPLPTLTEEYGRCINEKCVSENICCECYWSCYQGVCARRKCENNVDVYECNAWCKDISAYGSIGIKINSENYTCSGTINTKCKLK